ncbi:hypothetical protein [Streptomyces antibioticus]|uniref:hypothetical protein n=1 Tax=Streptomyces antibioticus TaxID=1890 RepID=UPI003D70D357
MRSSSAAASTAAERTAGCGSSGHGSTASSTSGRTWRQATMPSSSVSPSSYAQERAMARSQSSTSARSGRLRPSHG